MGSLHSFSTCFEPPESSKHVENERRLPMKIKDSPQVTSCWLFFKQAKRNYFRSGKALGWRANLKRQKLLN